MKRFITVLLVSLLLLSGCTAKPEKAAEPVSGKYCVMGVDGERTYPESTAQRFDFENGRFRFQNPGEFNGWMTRGTLTVEGSRVTCVSNDQKVDWTKDPIEFLGNYTWIFELDPDGNLHFISEGSDTFHVYGTDLNDSNFLVRVGDLDKPLD